MQHYLKDEIGHFSKETLQLIEVCIVHNFQKFDAERSFKTLEGHSQ
jgi:hypothetical protein